MTLAHAVVAKNIRNAAVHNLKGYMKKGCVLEDTAFFYCFIIIYQTS